MNGKIWTGLRFHGIARDGIEISRDCTGRDFTGRKKHGTPRDGIEISRDFTGRDFTGRKKHGTPRDRIEISRDCTGRDVKTILHGICTVHSKHSVSYDIVWTACHTGGCIRVVFDRTELFFINKKNF